MPDGEKELKFRIAARNRKARFKSTFLKRDMSEHLNQPSRIDLGKWAQLIIIGKRFGQGQEKSTGSSRNQWEPKRIGYYEAYFAMRRRKVRLLTEMIGPL